MSFRRDATRRVFRVIEDDRGWSVFDEARNRRLGRYQEKGEAIEVACIAAEHERASQVVSHRRDGSVEFAAPGMDDELDVGSLEAHDDEDPDDDDARSSSA